MRKLIMAGCPHVLPVSRPWIEAALSASQLWQKLGLMECGCRVVQLEAIKGVMQLAFQRTPVALPYSPYRYK